MASIAELSADNPALAVQADILARPATPERSMADAIRALAIDAVEKAKSGHPGMPMGMADVATVLWTRFQKYDAADPRWPDRDRFVLSAGHGSMLLYALLNLTGHAGMEIDKLKRFRQLHSPTAGHPEFGEHPAIETTTGPLGQGIATAVGMALAERLLAARFGRSLVDHRTWVIAGDGCLMEGISHEAIGLAGHLRLEKLTVLWDDNSISIDGATSLSTSEDQVKRFAAAGWAVKRVDGHDPAMVAAALSMAVRSKKPTLIACRTLIGFGVLVHVRFVLPACLLARLSTVPTHLGVVAALHARVRLLTLLPLQGLHDLLEHLLGLLGGLDEFLDRGGLEHGLDGRCLGLARRSAAAHRVPFRLAVVRRRELVRRLV